MSDFPVPAPRAKSRAFLLYVLVWMLLGGAAAGYLIALAVEPDIVALYMPAFRGAGGESALSGEVSSLRESVGQAQLDIARLRVDVDAHDTRGDELAERLASIESRPAHSAGPSSSPPAPGDSPLAERKESTAVPAQAAPESAGTDAATPPVTIVNGSGKGTPTVETGSVDRANPAGSATTPSQAAAKSAPRLVAVQIGTAPSLDTLRLTWLQLSDRHADSLRGLEARYVAGRDGGEPSYALMAGPLKTPSDAKRLCAALEGDGVPCKVGSFGGNAL